MKKKKPVLTNGKLLIGIIIIVVVTLLVLAILCSKKHNNIDPITNNNISNVTALKNIEDDYEYEEELKENSENIYQVEISDIFAGCFEISDIEVRDNDGITIITANVKNTQGNKYMETPIYINLYDDNENIVQVIEGTIPEIEYNETKFIEIWANNVYYDATNMNILLDN